MFYYPQYNYGYDTYLNSAITLLGACENPKTYCWGDSAAHYCGWQTQYSVNYAGTYSISPPHVGLSIFYDITFGPDGVFNIAGQAANYGYLGCFIMPSASVSFQPVGFTNSFNTINLCFHFCATLNMAYAAMGYQTGSKSV